MKPKQKNNFKTKQIWGFSGVDRLYKFTSYLVTYLLTYNLTSQLSAETYRRIASRLISQKSFNDDVRQHRDCRKSYPISEMNTAAEA